MDKGTPKPLLNDRADVPDRTVATSPHSATAELAVSILRAALDCVIVIDHSGHIAEWNAAAEQTFGYTRDEALGREISGLIIPQRFRAAHHAGLAHFRATGQGPILNRRVEIPALRRDGTEFPAELAVVPVEESPPRFAAYLRDITARQSAEDELRRSAAAQARRAKHAALRIEVSTGFARGGTLPEMLQRCAETLLEHLDAAFVCVHTSDTDGGLVPQAGAGMTDPAARHNAILACARLVAPVAQDRQPRLANAISAEDRAVEAEWARSEAITSFAGWPLLLEDRLAGVLSVFAIQPLTPDMLDAMVPVADVIAQGIYRKQMEQRLIESETKQRDFLRDVLASVTGGRFRLCERAADLPTPLLMLGEPTTLTRHSLKSVRGRAGEAVSLAGLRADRGSDLVTAVSEATMNAVIHANGGTATVRADTDTGQVQVWVEDTGEGIAMNHLPRAALERGYTTSGTLGHGFKMMLQTVDRLWLLTGSDGTTVVLEQGREASPMGWLEDL